MIEKIFDNLFTPANDDELHQRGVRSFKMSLHKFIAWYTEGCTGVSPLDAIDFLVVNDRAHYDDEDDELFDTYINELEQYKNDVVSIVIQDPDEYSEYLFRYQFAIGSNAYEFVSELDIYDSITGLK